MTLEEYYIKRSELKAPEGLDFIKKRQWFIESVQKLHSKLSNSDLKIVTDRQKAWENKVNSSIS